MSLRVLTVLGAGKVGGAEAFFVSLSVAMKRADVTMRGILRPNAVHENQLRDAGIPFDTASFEPVLGFLTRRRIKKLASAFKPDIVLTFAGRASQMTPKGDYTLIGRLGGYYDIRHFKNCDYLVCNTPDLVRYCVEKGWPRERVFHIANFPFLEKGVPTPRATFGTPEGAPLALALGRLHKNKGLDVLVKAAARIPGLQVWIAGEGPERTELTRLAHRLGAGDRIKFLGWRTDRAELFGAADICVFPSRREPFGNVIVEAWGYGVPLVSTAAIGPKWLIRDGKDGILTPLEDPVAFAEGIRKVLGAPDLARRMVDNGKARIQQEFTEDAIVRQYLSLFERLRPGRRN